MHTINCKCVPWCVQFRQLYCCWGCQSTCSSKYRGEEQKTPCWPPEALAGHSAPFNKHTQLLCVHTVSLCSSSLQRHSHQACVDNHGSPWQSTACFTLKTRSLPAQKLYQAASTCSCSSSGSEPSICSHCKLLWAARNINKKGSW